MTPTDEQVERELQLARNILAGNQVCESCDSAWTAAQLATKPGVLSCCPERKLRDATSLEQRLAAAIAALPPQGDGWQDIATAPRDGTRILVAAKHHGEWFVFEARWASGHNAWLHVDETSLAGKVGRGDLWQHLPAPPAAKIERTKG